MASSPDSDGIVSRTYEPLPLGAIQPRGWLRRQLEIQADGLTGNLDEVWEDLSNNAWTGGEKDGWERGPYYADGLVPLAFLLDGELVEKAEGWVESFLDATHDSGWIGPETVEDHLDPDDPWPRFVVCKVLRQYYEATGDERATEAIRSFAEYLLAHPDDWSIDDWAAMRWMDLAVTLHWLYEQTGEDWLLETVDLLVERGFDWTEHFQNFRFTEKVPDERRMETHVVNNAMGLKAPAVTYRQTGDEQARDGSQAGIEALDKYHGQVTGLFSGDEHFSGKHPSQGTELCAVVEYMYSLEYLASVHGDPVFGDRLERLAYNALPATFTPDMWAHQYDQQANQVLCNVAERAWTNGPTANIFGQTPHFGCCHANFHQGWPKLASNLWMETPDGGLAAVAYAPSEVTTILDGTTVTVIEETDYPFDDTIRLHVDVDEPTSFPLHVRIPSWADNSSVALPDGDEIRAPEAGTYRVVEREWHPGDEVTLAVNPTIETERRHHGSVSLHRGPLVFSLPVEAERKLIGGEPPHGDWEYYPTESWNYGLDTERINGSSPADLTIDGPGETPFSGADPPMTLRVTGRRVPEWRLEDSWAGEIPLSPIYSDAESEELELVPYGCTTLRVSEFPLLE